MSKLLFAEYGVTVLTRSVATGRFSCARFALPCPVIALDRGSGENMKVALQHMAHAPLLSKLRCSSPDIFSCDISCADRAGQNRRAEDGMYAEAAEAGLRVKLRCFAHCVSTSQGEGYSAVSADLTGSISASLIMCQGAEMTAFRECIVEVLVNSVVQPVLDAPPLPANHEAVVYLTSLLRICMPCSEEGKLRAELLLQMLSGDVREPLSSCVWLVEVPICVSSIGRQM